MKRTHISYSLDRTCLILLITLALLSLILLLTVGQNKSSPSTDTSSNQQKHFILDQNLNDPSQLPRLPRFAYFISGTKGDVSSVKRLLQAVYHPRNYYLLHLDFEASDGERLELAKYVKVESGVMRKFGNVMVLGKGDLVTYKGPTMIASILHGVAILLKQFEDWDWFVNLSAEDYPLMPQDDILHIFSYLPRDLNFLEHTSGIGWKEHERAKPIIIDPGLYHTKKSGVFWAKEKRSLPAAFKLFMGSELVVLTRSFLEFCVWGWDNLPRTVLMYYTNFLSSTEGYFHTVICNQKDYQNTTVNHDLHYLKWDNPPKQYPLNLTVEHFEDMVASGAPFARKFAKDDQVLNKIDRELLGIPDGQLTRGRWCAGKSLSDKDPCVVYGSPFAVKPGTVNSKRLEKLMVKLLDSENFRSKQCK
ncbi:PREDICTED: xylosyltransferase-like [Populus euphratica]|uniref:Xylosyltransferase-like n=1 Tax=Populus euphratica TaxID=75702 RepID=A0AAJ6UKL9_POPEU|nr:PREDICTED: xylosyltransferase-like [Populus euphratica]